MVNLFDLIQQKLELFRLEQRYTKRRHRRSTFVSEAMYVDGEYVYTTPPSLNTTGSSNSSNSRASSQPKIPSKRHSVVDFRAVNGQEDEDRMGGVGIDEEKSKSWGRNFGQKWNAGRARDKRINVTVVREVPIWEEEIR